MVSDLEEQIRDSDSAHAKEIWNLKHQVRDAQEAAANEVGAIRDAFGEGCTENFKEIGKKYPDIRQWARSIVFVEKYPGIG